MYDRSVLEAGVEESWTTLALSGMSIGAGRGGRVPHLSATRYIAWEAAARYLRSSKIIMPGSINLHHCVDK